MEIKSLIILLFFVAVNASPFDDEFTDFTQLMKILNKPRKLDRYRQGMGSLGVKSFSWSDCGAKGDPLKISQVKITPDPVKIPGNVTVNVDWSLEDALTKPIKLALEVKKKVLFWITVPCVDNLGSCTYDDICPMIFPGKPCPPIFLQKKIPCHCPFKSGSYSLSNFEQYLDPKGLPEWLADGDYEAKATLTHNGKQIGCLQMTLSLVSG